MGPAERAPREWNVPPAVLARLLYTQEAPLRIIAQISIILLASCRQAGHGLYQRLCFSGTPASPPTERDVPATSY